MVRDRRFVTLLPRVHRGVHIPVWINAGLKFLAIEDAVLDDLGLLQSSDGGPNRAIRDLLTDTCIPFVITAELCYVFGWNAIYNPIVIFGDTK